MVKTSIQFIKEAAKKLINSKLQKLDTAESQEIFKGVMQTTGLETIEEVYLFVALFDRTCSDESSCMSDLSDYFKCSSLDMMEYIPALESLKRKGLIMRYGRTRPNILSQDFMVSNDAISAILENRPVSVYNVDNNLQLSKYEFCDYISNDIESRDITTFDLIEKVKTFENQNSQMSFVKELQKKVDNITDRILFYEICHDDFAQNGKGGSDFGNTLSDIFDNIRERVSVKKSILSGKHILITLNLVEMKDEDELILTDYGKEFFYEEDLSIFTQSYKCDNIYTFLKTLSEFFHNGREYNSDSQRSSYILRKYLPRFENENKHLPTVQHICDSISNEYDRVLFYSMGNDLVNGESTPLSHEVRTIYSLQERKKAICEFKDKTHVLQKKTLVDIEKKDSFFGENTYLILTDKGIEELFGEDAKMFIQKESNKNLLACDKIVEKQLFFSPQLEKQLSLLRNSLSQEYYKGLCERLETNNLPKGMAVLLYGKPGTGKTESVMQIAKATGRDIMHVDISATKSCWFGESEKLIKKVFTDYRRICDKSKVKPILLFNEADAIFSTRKDITGSDRGVGQTENAIQNIILEEMENLDGILIATTNLADNLDKAFERRFLFKIYFDLPTIEAKTNIWKDKLPTLSTEEATTLASTFEFSGGQIDNIVRKSLIQEVISGNKPTLNDLITMCSEEKISKNGVRKMGFC